MVVMVVVGKHTTDVLISTGSSVLIWSDRSGALLDCSEVQGRDHIGVKLIVVCDSDAHCRYLDRWGGGLEPQVWVGGVH